MDDDFEDQETFRPAAKFRWQVAVGIVLGGVGGMLGELAGIAETLAIQFVADSNYQDDRVEFHEQAAIELEMLTTEDFDG